MMHGVARGRECYTDSLPLASICCLPKQQPMLRLMCAFLSISSASNAMSQAFTPSPADQAIAEIAAQCVMCGLCLPHCPSYITTRNESESPRGRLALMARIASGDATATSYPSLDSCLACGRCEQVCPPKVAFLEGLALTRSNHAPATERLIGRMARRLTKRPGAFRHLFRMAVASRSLVPRRLRRRLNLDGAAAISGTTHPSRPSCHGATVPATLLFASCTSDLTEPRAVEALKRIAATLGSNLTIEGKLCCGAIDRHLGYATTRPAVIGPEFEHLVAINSGCTAQWQRLVAPRKVTAIAAWLNRLVATHGDRFTPQPMRVALHLPCTQQGLAGEAEAMRQLIDALPGAERIELPSQPGCCGAAGTYFLNQPDISRTLGTTLAQQIRSLQPDVIVSANGGCRTQLAQALFDLDAPLRVVHPAELIADYLTGQH